MVDNAKSNLVAGNPETANTVLSLAIRIWRQNLDVGDEPGFSVEEWRLLVGKIVADAERCMEQGYIEPARWMMSRAKEHWGKHLAGLGDPEPSFRRED